MRMDLTARAAEINWAVVFDKLFKEIDGRPGTAFYFDGRDFIEKLQQVGVPALDYESLMARRKGEGKSTVRREYFHDLFFQAEEKKRVAFVLQIVSELESRGHSPYEEIRRLIGDGTDGPVPNLTDELWNGDRLKGFLTKIDSALNLKDPERVLTLCDTCMEGFFKAYIKKNLPDQAEENEIIALARIVKDDLKERNKEYPGEVFNVITQSTFALDKIRNKFSESHFAEEADHWAAVYARDLVNTHVRLILQFL